MSGTNDVMKRIVVGVGPGETSEHAIRDALRLATEIDGVTVHFVGVIEHADRTHLDRLRQRLLDTEATVVGAVRAIANTTPLTPARIDLVFHVRVGDVVQALTQVAYDVDASMIVVGAHRARHPIPGLSGGVGERLILDGRFPVLVARPVTTSGMTRTQRPDPRRPGEPLHDSRELLLESSDRVDFALPPPHVSGLL